ncbi:MAG: D-tyrosyl-tRNA(Tyr) deacylase [Flavobacteriales bacterium]|nr:D-tyrosyl-tRNA(Tyr) deacylase [Flavobacteriales bacterium]
MRCIVQRVSEASVTAEGQITGRIGNGLMVLVGIEEADGHEDVRWIAEKLAAMRIFQDEDGKMNLDINQVGGQVLLVSQFTLHALIKKGNRPSFIRAARPEQAIPLYEALITELGARIPAGVETGVFGAMMQVHLINDGPVTIFMDSKNPE